MDERVDVNHVVSLSLSFNSEDGNDNERRCFDWGFPIPSGVCILYTYISPNAPWEATFLHGPTRSPPTLPMPEDATGPTACKRRHPVSTWQLSCSSSLTFNSPGPTLTIQ